MSDGKSSKQEVRTLLGEAYVAVLTSRNDDGSLSVEKVKSVSICLGRPGCSIHTHLNRFKNSLNETVPDFFAGDGEVLERLLAEEEREQAKETHREPTIHIPV